MHLPDDVLSYRDDVFYDLVRDKCGETVEEMFKWQKIRSVQSLLRIDDVFGFMNYDSDELNELKQKVGFRLRTGSYQIRCGILADVDSLRQALEHLHDNVSASAPTDHNANDVTVSRELLHKHPLLLTLIEYYSTKGHEDKDMNMSFLHSFLENITRNMTRPKNSYRYDEHVKRFAVSLFILAGRNAYEFARANIPGALPSISSIQTLLDEEEKHMVEGEYRFDVLQRQLSLTDTNIAFCSEDSTAIIPRVVYEASSNSFIGITLPLQQGRPISESYRTDSLTELERWFSSIDKSTLLNIQMVQPIARFGQPSRPVILSAYGTNNKYTALDIMRRWIWIFDESLSRGIRVIGFSTDADPKYLRAMKLVLGFRASLPNMRLSDRSDAFEVSIPNDWDWFFLRPRQLILCFQDPVHLCTKLRNRLLSNTAEMIIGNQRVSLDVLSTMIASSNKLNHGFVKSDIYPRDRQNFASCEKISSDYVISTLEEDSESLATRLYLKLIRSTIIAYIDKTTSLNNRVYHCWFTVFVTRIWWTWLLVKAEEDLEEMLSWSSNPKASSQSTSTTMRRFFITDSSFHSIEINAHQLTYLLLLVIEGALPEESLQIFLFNSQGCESTFRAARAMSGAFSSIVNFSVTQFLRRAQKLSVLNRIKGDGEINPSRDTSSLCFPKHHKQTSKLTAATDPSNTSALTKDEIKRIVSATFDDALELFVDLRIHAVLKKRKIHTLRDLNRFICKNITYMCHQERSTELVWQERRMILTLIQNPTMMKAVLISLAMKKFAREKAMKSRLFTMYLM